MHTRTAILATLGSVAMLAVACTAKEELNKPKTVKAVEVEQETVPQTTTVVPTPVAVEAAQTAVPSTEYTIVKGDTLTGIAQTHYSNWRRYTDIAEANGIDNPDLIYAGHTLKLTN